MKCPICGKDVILQKKQVGTNENGEPILNQYAICKDCKKQWNLDKQRAKKMAARKAAEGTKAETPAATKKETEKVVEQTAVKTNPKEAVKATRPTEDEKAAKKRRPADGEAPNKRRPADSEAPKKRRPVDSEETLKKRRPIDGETPKKRRPANSEAPKKRRPADGEAQKKRRPIDGETPKKRRPVNSEAPKKRHPVEENAAQSAVSEEIEEQKYSNIPSKQVRTKREHAMRKGYEDMLSTDPSYKSKKKIEDEDDLTESKQRTMNAYDDGDEDEDFEDEYEPKAKFRVLRVLLGILSLGGFGFCIYSALMSGLDEITSGNTASAGMTYVILALCMFVSGLLLLIMQKSNSVFAFILPMILYLGGGVYAFIRRSGETNLLYCAIVGLVLAVIFLILTIASRGDSDDYDPSNDYDDPFEDDFE